MAESTAWRGEGKTGAVEQRARRTVAFVSTATVAGRPVSFVSTVTVAVLATLVAALLGAPAASAGPTGPTGSGKAGSGKAGPAKARPAVATIRGPGNLFYGTPMFADPTGPAATDAAAISGTDPSGSAAERRLAGVPVADWFANRSAAEIGPIVAAHVARVRAAGKLPLLVAYDIPGRDCGAYSAGGAASDADYLAWIKAFAAGIGSRQAAVILEPDALSHLDTCLTSAQQSDRLALLSSAASVLAAQPYTAVYLDAGASGWHTPAVMAQRLRAAGIGHARGFALNVADTRSTAESLAFGHSVSALLGGVPFVIDSSRNGSGPWTPSAGTPGATEPWCNPPGRTLGNLPSGVTGDPGVDAYVWVKDPGQSDGDCNPGQPASGTWNRAYAVDISERSPWPAMADARRARSVHHHPRKVKRTRRRGHVASAARLAAPALLPPLPPPGADYAPSHELGP